MYSNNESGRPLLIAGNVSDLFTKIFSPTTIVIYADIQSTGGRLAQDNSLCLSNKREYKLGVA